MSVLFSGGPMDGQMGGPPPDTGGGFPSDPMAAGPGAEEELSEDERFGRMLDDALALSGGGTLTEQSKLKMQKAMTLLQEIRAAEEKEGEDAMSGKVSPRLLTKAYAGAGGGS